MKAILALKNQMTTFFDNEGQARTATVLSAGPCKISAIRTKEKHGYEAAQLSIGTKIKKGKTKKEIPMYLKEMRDFEKENLKLGEEVNVKDIFKEGDLVTVTGLSKGKGFSGVVRRWSFKGGPRTHGQSDRERAPGSIGSTTTPGRVYKGKRMAGKMGNEKVTVKNLKVLKIEDNHLYLEGAVPGIKNGLIIIKKA